MSHEATNWAIKQRGLKPAIKLVLWHLCDRFHPDHGCFPSQDTLADDCEMSRASVNRALAALESAGLISREQRVNPQTGKQLSTRYRFPFEGHVSQIETRAVSQETNEPCLKNGESRVSICDTNLVREPSNRTSKANQSRKIPFSEEWAPSDDLRKWALGQSFDHDQLANEVTHCTAYYGGRGERFADLDQVFKAWLIQSKKRHRGNSAAQSPRASTGMDTQTASIIRDLAARRAVRK